MNKIFLKDLNEKFVDKSYIFILGLGFDQRCLTIINNFDIEKLVDVVGVSNVIWNDANKSNIDAFKAIVSGNGKVLGENASNIIEIVDPVSEYILGFVVNNDHQILIDITSFSHELLVLLIGIFNSFGIIKRVTLLYVGASVYGFNAQDGIPWLSRGVREIRSVLGFPGVMFPSKKLHLIVMAGFEVERAIEVIAQYEPSSLSIGTGHVKQSVSSDHFKMNEFFVDRIKKYIIDQDNYDYAIQHFEFSCVDPHKTKEQLYEHVATLKETSDKNIVICPLNTKISTVGAALLALEYPEIQICYAEPEEYNIDGYASPGYEVKIVPLIY